MPLARLSKRALTETIRERFVCERCGNCCKGEGVVQVDDEQAQGIADFLGLSKRSFLGKYAKPVLDGAYWLKEIDNEERWCVFLEQDAQGLYGCAINPVKPDQCGSYPQKWRNHDSVETCAGLKTLQSKLESKESEPSGESAPPLSTD